MRLTLKKIESIITELLGPNGIPLVNELYGTENVSEFDIAKNIKQDIKIVRRMLYILYNKNLVAFTRKKDKEKGWYIYYWTLLIEGIKFNYVREKKEQLALLQQKLEEESKELFFISPNKCIRLNFDDATKYDFRCPETGEMMHLDESRAEDIKKEIKVIEEELKKINEQVKKSKKRVVKKVKSTKSKAKKVVKKNNEKRKKAKPAKGKAKKIVRKPAQKTKKTPKVKKITKIIKKVKNKTTKSKRTKKK